jgi:pantetheine-phosphate adenylyltransferase
VYPGSFDPFTKGHLDIVTRASSVFDEVIVAVLNNPDKRPLFSVTERMDLIATSTQHLPAVRADSFMGLLVDYVKLKQATVMIRGLRSVADLEVELPMAQMNGTMYPQAITVFLATRPEFSHFSSSLIKQVAQHGGDVTGMVPDAVQHALLARVQE